MIKSFKQTSDYFYIIYRSSRKKSTAEQLDYCQQKTPAQSKDDNINKHCEIICFTEEVENQSDCMISDMVPTCVSPETFTTHKSSTE